MQIEGDDFRTTEEYVRWQEEKVAGRKTAQEWYDLGREHQEHDMDCPNCDDCTIDDYNRGYEEGKSTGEKDSIDTIEDLRGDNTVLQEKVQTFAKTICELRSQILTLKSKESRNGES